MCHIHIVHNYSLYNDNYIKLSIFDWTGVHTSHVIPGWVSSRGDIRTVVSFATRCLHDYSMQWFHHFNTHMKSSMQTAGATPFPHTESNTFQNLCYFWAAVDANSTDIQSLNTLHTCFRCIWYTITRGMSAGDEFPPPYKLVSASRVNATLAQNCNSNGHYLN